MKGNKLMHTMYKFHTCAYFSWQVTIAAYFPWQVTIAAYFPWQVTIALKLFISKFLMCNLD